MFRMSTSDRAGSIEARLGAGVISCRGGSALVPQERGAPELRQKESNFARQPAKLTVIQGTQAAARAAEYAGMRGLRHPYIRRGEVLCTQSLAEQRGVRQAGARCAFAEGNLQPGVPAALSVCFCRGGKVVTRHFAQLPGDSQLENEAPEAFQAHWNDTQ